MAVVKETLPLSNPVRHFKSGFGGIGSSPLFLFAYKYNQIVTISCNDALLTPRTCSIERLAQGPTEKENRGKHGIFTTSNSAIALLDAQTTQQGAGKDGTSQ